MSRKPPRNDLKYDRCTFCFGNQGSSLIDRYEQHESQSESYIALTAYARTRIFQTMLNGAQSEAVRDNLKAGPRDPFASPRAETGLALESLSDSILFLRRKDLWNKLTSL